MRKNKTFKQSIFLNFVLATFLPLACLAYLSYSYLGFKITETNNENNKLLASGIAADIADQLQDPIIILRQTGIFLQSSLYTNSWIDKQLNTIVENSSYLETLMVLDAKKRVINIGLDERFKENNATYLNLDLSRLHVLSKAEFLQGPYWTNTFRSPVSMEKSIALVYPISPERFLFGIVNISYLHSSLSAESDRYGHISIILDDLGNPVFHPELTIVEEQVNFAGLAPYKDSQLGVFGDTQFNLGDTEYIGSTAKIGGANWLVIIAEPIDMAKKPQRDMTTIFVYAVLIGAILVIGLALRLSRRIVRPLNDFQKSIQAVAEGDYSKNIEKQQFEEFEAFSLVLRNMSAAIRDREQKLELNEERLTALLEIHTLKQLEESELLSFALEKAVLLTRSEMGYLHLVDESEKTIQKTLWSIEAEEYSMYHEMPLEIFAESAAGLDCLKYRQPIFHNSAGEGLRDDYQDTSMVIAWQRQLANPIFDGEHLVAIVGVVDKNINYDSKDARQLSLYFNHIWDILQQKRYEKEKAHLAEQLAQAQKLEAIGTLAGGIAHDFNNLLMVIVGNTELARDNLEHPEKIGDDLDEIFQASLRARDLVNQILAFSRDQAEDRKPLNIAPLVKEAIRLLRSSIPANINIKQHISEQSLPVLTEPTQINQLIMNLCTNAYHALDSGGGELEIRLSPICINNELLFRERVVAKKGEYMHLVIKDNGAGMSDEVLNRIFEPYFTTKEKGRGTGLGLAVVHGIVKSMHGAILVESTPGKGSIFEIYLPAVQKQEQRAEDILVGNLPGGEEHILLVEDDQAVAKTNSLLLESLGYSVTTVHSGVEALTAVTEEKNDYDLIITDLDMPKMTGQIFAKKLKEMEVNIPVMLCTGYSDRLSEEEVEELGIREIMLKPLTKIDLALTVRKVLGFS